MPDTPTPLDLDAIRDDLDARVPARDLEDRNHARGLLAEVERLRAEVATERAEVTRLRTMVGDCHCDKNPETTNGPEEDCPQHGRPVAEVWDLVKGAETGWDRARAEVDRLCAEARLANASAHSAGLALGARLDHPHGGFPEGTWLAEQFDAARPAPAWDEEAVVEGMARAMYPFLFADDRQPLRVFGETRSDAELREGERDVARERMRQALAVVREHLPVKPGRETVIEAMLGSDIITDDLRAEASAQGSTQREPFLCFADAVLDLLPGRSEAEVKAEAFADAWARTHPKEAPMADLERRNPYRSPSGCGCDLTGMAPPAVHIVDNHEGGAS